jgi:hypothetical protein
MECTVTHGLLSTVTDHAGAMTAGAASTVATLAVASTTPAPAGVPAWLPYVGSLAGPVLAWVGARVLIALATRQRAIAEAKHRRALALLADNDKSNDALAQQLEDEADAAQATADALDAARGIHHDRPGK